MPKLTVDGVEVEVPAGATVLQAIEATGKEVPRFCYHDRLSIAGNCRMCLVEIKPGPPKPAASCAMPAGENMEVFTNSPMVEHARKGVMEMLLINHPLDCPICDQGGECDLQDQAMSYGGGASRYDEMKRAVPDKYMGPLVKTIMTRCIHCTRCVRFVDEVAGVPTIGALGRGGATEISTLEAGINSELSGNIIDLCPVGALTSRPYEFVARPWELSKTESVDVMDAVGSNIRVDARGPEVLRVLPRLNEDVNEEWISDKTRFAIDGLKRQRLDTPYVRGADGRLKATSWTAALNVVAEKLKATAPEKIAVIAGDQVDAEAMFAAKALFENIGVQNIDCRQDGMKIAPGTPRGGYILNEGLSGVEKADRLLLIGSDPRREAAVFGARIRKRWLEGDFKVGVVGEIGDQTYPTELVSLESAAEFLQGASRPMVIVGAGALARADGASVLAHARSLATVTDEWVGFGVLHTAASRVAGLDLSFLPGPEGQDVAGMLAGVKTGDIETVFLLGADEINFESLKGAFVIYQGAVGDEGAGAADVVLPGAAFTEKDGTYVNTEGRAQRASRAVFPPGDAREDWTILRALSEVLGSKLPFDDLISLRAQMIEKVPVLGAIDEQMPGVWGEFGEKGLVEDEPMQSAVKNFYMTCPISRASPTMARCVQEFMNSSNQDRAHA
jgi:NADH-quinone oxidoreductase subunit G